MKILVVSSDRTGDDHVAINLGDALLTDALVQALRARGHSPLVADFGHERHGDGEPRLKLDGVASLVRAVRAADAVIIGGGTLLQDDGPKHGLGGLPRLCATVVGVAKATGTPVGFYAVGCDPVERFLPKMLLRFAVHNVPVFVRETTSAERVNGQLRGTAHVGADASLLLSHRTAPATEGGPLVLTLNRKHAAAVTAEHVSALRAKYGSVVFLNMSQSGDGLTDSAAVEPAALALFDRVTSTLSWPEAESIIAGASAVVGSRMHALYASMLLGRPMVAVSDLPKVVTFATEFEVPRVGSIAEVSSVEPRLANDGVLSAATSRAVKSLDDLLAAL
ncbi:polysaccharide pyruvyl transferase WcaK-like protein [Conyzicola lurida]|uniref:Polysaccharide pyruvyl transferase WcaK-like protein n=1 Tax=Conyzicola lurida TaxID=1172621 RepID=A0A841AS69_9MICO|nr:polysaccharide pyruvyl transferase WcaK-like protein [Conyzicola lurida]